MSSYIFGNCWPIIGLKNMGIDKCVKSAIKWDENLEFKNKYSEKLLKISRLTKKYFQNQ